MHGRRGDEQPGRCADCSDAEGTLQPAGLTSDGPLHIPTNAEGKAPLHTDVVVPVELRADFPDGSTRFKTKGVEIFVGWG